jgi:hypothetical protein
MKIAFNGFNSGFANNGGSRTILLSAKTLEFLGCNCDIIANIDNFTWFDHKPVIRVIPKKLDALINVAAVDYMTTKKANVPVKFAWWRGHEVWANSKDYLIKCYKDTHVKNLVNSYGLKKLLEKYGAESEVIYQGIDFDWWTNKNYRGDKIRIGCLYHSMGSKRWKDFVSLYNKLGIKDYEYVAFGAKRCDADFLTKYLKSPSKRKLNDLYSSCHIWFAPTINEGLHNVPIEAALCGCLIVGNNNPRNGMIYDYLFDGKTGMVYDSIDDAVDKIKNPDFSLVDNAIEHIKTNIGTRESNMSKLINLIRR